MRYRSVLYGVTWFCLRPYPNQRPVTSSGLHSISCMFAPWESLVYRTDRVGD